MGVAGAGLAVVVAVMLMNQEGDGWGCLSVFLAGFAGLCILGGAMIDEGAMILVGLLVGGLAWALVVRALFNPFAPKGATVYERSALGRLLSWAVVGLGVWLIWLGAS